MLCVMAGASRCADVECTMYTLVMVKLNLLWEKLWVLFFLGLGYLKGVHLILALSAVGKRVSNVDIII